MCASRSTDGTYTVAGRAARFTKLTGDGSPTFAYTGVVEGNTLTCNFDGNAYAYRK
jgi:hypothetical protein